MKNENISQFYQRINLESEISLNENLKNGYFNVFTRTVCPDCASIGHHAFYKLSFIRGEGILHYTDRSIHINRPAIIISNPLIPYSWEVLSDKQSGYFCVFTDTFVRKEERQESLNQSPLFRVGDNKVFFLVESEQKEIEDIYEKMCKEIQSDHIQKWDILRSYVHLLIYKAMQMQAPESYTQDNHNSKRIVNLFLELLDKRF